ncbi:MAG: MFS transporter [Phycisphaerales bacterium]|nr:MFS transporter [Phycisphaerales bacterium]
MKTHTPSQQGVRGFAALLVAMSCGAMNDNLLRGALLVAVAVGGTHAWAGELGSGGTGWVTFMLYVPFIVLLGVTGQLADRFPRRTIIIISRVLEVALSGLAVLAFALGNLYLACGTLMLMAAQSALFSPAKYGIVPDLVGDAALSRANGLLSMLTNVMIIAGMAVSGLLLEQGGLWLGLAMVVVATTGLCASLCIPRGAAAQPELKFTWRTFSAHIDNLAAMRGTPAMIATISWCWFYAIGSLMIAIIPNYTNVLSLSQAQAGMMLAAPGVGIAVGGLAAGFGSGDRIRGRLVPLGGALMTVGLILLALVPPTQLMLWILLGLTGVAAGLFVIPILSLLQHLPAAGFRARCIGTANFCTYLAMSVSALTYAMLADQVGSDPSLWFLACGLLMGGMSLYTFVKREVLRTAGLHAAAGSVASRD